MCEKLKSCPVVNLRKLLWTSQHQRFLFNPLSQPTHIPAVQVSLTHPLLAVSAKTAAAYSQDQHAIASKPRWLLQVGLWEVFAGTRDGMVVCHLSL